MAHLLKGVGKSNADKKAEDGVVRSKDSTEKVEISAPILSLLINYVKKKNE